MRTFWRNNQGSKHKASGTHPSEDKKGVMHFGVLRAIWGVRAWLLLLTLCSLIVIFFWHPYFRVSQIDCVYEDGTTCPEEIIQEFLQLQGRHIFQLESQPIEIKLTTAVSEIDEIVVSPSLPNLVSIRIGLHQPSLYLQTDPGGIALVISESMEVIRADETLDMELPRLLHQEAFVYSIGDQISEPVVVAAKGIIKELQQEFVQFLWVEIVDSEQIRVELANGNEAVFSAAVDLEKQVDALVRVQTHIDLSESAKTVEVRFEQPVIKSR